MARKRKMPLVVICGRPNVGKSTLFNRLTGRQSAIVHFEEGITRDRAYGKAEWEGRKFEIVDTGGIVENPSDPVLFKMQEQVRAAFEEASVILFVVDGQQDITRIDEELRDELFKYGKPIVLAANKLDNERMTQNYVEFYVLGMGDPVPISAGHGLGIEELMDAIVEHFPPVPETDEVELEPEEPAITKVAVIGKPNVGKSSFVNALLNENRVIVDDTPGTTRDAIDVELRLQDRNYLLIDTAGLRRKAGITKHVEHFSVARSLRAVRRADVCLVMMGADEGVSEQDKRIFNYVFEQGRAMIIVWTKWDLIEDKEARLKELKDDLDLKAPFLSYVPQVTISNVTRQRVVKALEYVDRIAAEAAKRIDTSELNRFMEEVRTGHLPPAKKGKYAKILYATQASVRPTKFVLFVNQRALFHFSYLRYIENKLRAKYGFEGVPIHIELREEKRQK